MNIAALVSLLHAVMPWLPLWAATLGVAAALLAAAFALQDIVMRLLAHHIAQTDAMLQSLFRKTRGVVRFAIILLVASAATPLLPLPATLQSGLQRGLVAAFVVLLGWLVLVAADTAAESYLHRLKLDVRDNLLARKAVTQVRVLKRVFNTLILVLTAGFALMTFDSVRQFGISIFASAGAAGLVLGLAARPVLGNLIAGIQIALSQPIRIDDAVVLEGEWGWIEELTATYVVVRLWDRRRLIVPLSYFLEKPFQNWTRNSASIIGTVMLYLDYTAPIDRIRGKAKEIAAASALWDGDVFNLQVSDARDNTIEVRVLVSAENSPKAWDLRCEVREKLLAYVQAEIPTALPRRRNLNAPGMAATAMAASEPR
jgi:small-conductance mechanosensitive channel